MNNILISNINKNYKNIEVLKDINLNINNGVFGLLGPNGAGKTTLIKILSTLLTPDSGTIKFNDISWDNKDNIRELIGYLPQNFSIYDELTVLEVLQYISKLKGINNSDVQIDDILIKTELKDNKLKKIKNLSGGMLRRLGLAQALLGNPKIIIIDEPTAGLDPEKRVKFRNLLNDLSKDKIVLISTHIVEDIEATCNNIAILNNGKIIFNGTSEILKNKVNNLICEASILQSHFNNIKSKINIINYKYIKDYVKIRFILDKNITFPYEIVEPTLEDAYFYLIGEKNDKKITFI